MNTNPPVAADADADAASAASPLLGAASPLLGAGILAAALLLPGVQAQAETAPERGLVSLKYLDYRDGQPGFERITVHSPSLRVVAPLAGEWSLEAGLSSQDVSGASPRYHTAKSGASKFSDLRKSGDVSVTRYFPQGSLTVGAVYSTEKDYVSRALSLQGSRSSEDRNTTWTFGIGGADDDIHPANLRVRNEKKKTHDVLFGVTQVLGARDIAQFNLTHAQGQGYFSDPYKAFDNRPRVRRQSAFLMRWNHHFAVTGGSSRLSYRYYRDSFAVKAHTFAAEYEQPLAQGFSVTPLLRIHSQSAAGFYVDPVYDATYGAPFPAGHVFGSAAFISQDQRLAAFGARSLGLKISRQISRDLSVDLKLESYRQRAGWRLFGQGSPGLEPFSARVVQLGITHWW